MLQLLAFAAAMAAAPVSAHDAALQAAFECRGVADTIDSALAAHGIPTDATPHKLSPPIAVFGLDVDQVTVFREGGEDSYSVMLVGKSAAELAAAASIPSGTDGYQRTADAGLLSAFPLSEGAMLRCSITFE